MILDERVQERDGWGCDEAAREAMSDLQSLYELEGSLVEGYNEDALIDNWIDEVLKILGFGTQVEVTLPDGNGFVDELLFETPTTRRDAAEIYLETQKTTDLFERGLGIVEVKQWDAAFNIRFSEQRPYRNASHQTKHYLEHTPASIQWGILTNGRKWRLYGIKNYEAQTYYEVDLPELLERGDLDTFKYFYVFFQPDVFNESSGTTFHDEIWSESETASQELGESLQDNVFTALRVLGRGFVETNNDLDIDPDDEEALDELKKQSLVFLYRLMFVLYAKARGLIHPRDRGAQDEYDQNFSLDELRLDIHEKVGEVDDGFEDAFSDYSKTMWSRLEDLFRLIDEGEEDLGIPPYNGGLFDHEKHAFLTEHEVSNQYLAEVIYRLSTAESFIAESRELGVNKRIPIGSRSQPPAVNPFRTRLWLIHPQAVVIGEDDDGNDIYEAGIIGYSYIPRIIHTCDRDGEVLQYIQEHADARQLHIASVGPEVGFDESYHAMTEYNNTPADESPADD